MTQKMYNFTKMQSQNKTKFRRLAEIALEKDRVEKVLRAERNFEQSFDQNQDEHRNNFLEVSNDKQSLQFNAQYFEAKRAKMLPARCHEVVLKSPKDRTIGDIKTLRSYMVGLKSFELYSPKMQMALCRVVRFESFGRGRVIVRKGAQGTSMYFISYGKGTVFGFLPLYYCRSFRTQ